MKKILCMVLALMVALSLVACTSGDADKTPADNAVTIRDRDTMEQERVPLTELKEYLKKRIFIY